MIQKQILKSKNGFSLIELMVSVGIFGILALGVASLYTENAKIIVRTEGQIEMSDQITEFTNILQDYLGGLTYFVSCGCSNAGANCVYDTALPDCNNGGCATGNAPLAVFEYEDALVPAMYSTNAECLNGATNPPTNAGNSILLRGCKKMVSLNYVPPVQATGTPGKLTLMLIDPATAQGTQTPLRIISQLVGVTSLRCGQVYMPGSNTVTSPDHFKLDISMKSGARGRDTVAAYPPTPAAGGGVYVSQNAGSFFPGGANFGNGIHRDFTIDVGFRNLNMPGVYFGRPYTIQNCVLDGAVSMDGGCCSGYREDPSSGLCIAADSCLLRGSAASEYGQCCTHTIESGVCQW